MNYRNSKEQHATVEPIRPPLREPRKKSCPCGRRPLFISRAPRARRGYHTDSQHSLCDSCFRRIRDSVRGRGPAGGRPKRGHGHQQINKVRTPTMS